VPKNPRSANNRAAAVISRERVAAACARRLGE